MKILVLTSRFPYPLEKGDKLRVFYQIRELSKNHEVFLFSINDQEPDQEQIENLKPYCREIEYFVIPPRKSLKSILKGILSNRPFQVSYFYSREAQDRLQSFVRRINPDHIYCQLIRMAEYARKFASIPKTLDYMDAFSKNMERRKHQTSFPSSLIFKEEARRVRKYEALVFEDFKEKTIISSQDREYIDHPERDRIHVIPNGIDTTYFSGKAGQEKRTHDLLFLGNMAYYPNVQTAIFLAREVMPRLRKEFPEFNLIIAGANPKPAVRNLEAADIKVPGYVEDIREVYLSARIFVAPIFLGSGLQNKLLEAMSMGLPCITTTLCNNALKAQPGKEIFIADDADEFVEQIKNIVMNPEVSNTVARNGQDFVRQNFNWKHFVEKLENLFAEKIKTNA